VAFDAYGTLFDVSAAIASHRAAFGRDADQFAALWRAKQLEYTWTLTLMGRYEDFWTLTQRALDYCLLRFPSVDNAIRTSLLDAYCRLTAYGDVGPTLRRLKNLGVRVAVFTNGNLEMVNGAIVAAGISGLLDVVVSVDAIGKYKTSPEAYAYLCQKLDLRADQITLVSSNRWDVAGGRAHGLNAVWCNRSNMPDEYLDLSPTQTVVTLADIIL
jgi:2-haloacid dehalogenase